MIPPSGLLGSSPIALSDVPFTGALLTASPFPCTRGLAHIVREQLMAKDAKSKATANFLRFRFIDFFLWFLILALLHPSRAFLFGSCTNVFLLVKAETAVKTRQVFAALQQTRTQFLQRSSGQTLVDGTRPKTVARLRYRLTGTSKAAVSRPLTAAEVRTTLAYSGSTAIPNGLGQLGTNC